MRLTNNSASLGCAWYGRQGAMYQGNRDTLLFHWSKQLSHLTFQDKW